MTVVDQFHDGDEHGVRGEGRSDYTEEAQAGLAHGVDGQGAAKDERQHDGQDHGGHVSPEQGGTDGHTEDLTDGAAS